jgi:hypothetical protein
MNNVKTEFYGKFAHQECIKIKDETIAVISSVNFYNDDSQEWESVFGCENDDFTIETAYETRNNPFVTYFFFNDVQMVLRFHEFIRLNIAKGLDIEQINGSNQYIVDESEIDYYNKWKERTQDIRGFTTLSELQELIGKCTLHSIKINKEND